MGNVTTGVLDKNKEHYSRSKDKAENHMMYCIKTYTIAYDKIQINEDLQSIMSNLQPNYCFKVDFQKVDKQTGGKGLIHDTKRHKDNQLQSLKLPCRIYKMSS